MTIRTLVATLLFVTALALHAQAPYRSDLYKLELFPTGTIVSVDAPTLKGQAYIFKAWPDGASTKVPQSAVKRITRLSGPSADTVYRIDLVPSGTVIAKDMPTLKGNAYVFRTYRGGALTSLRKSDVKQISPVTGDDAFWIEQGQMNEVNIRGPLAMEGAGQVVEIGTPQQQSSQAGPQSASQISGAPVGNWQYQGTPGTSDAYGPANATMSGGVPTMPAATSGSAPPQ
jgi:hypothetical protein